MGHLGASPCRLWGPLYQWTGVWGKGQRVGQKGIPDTPVAHGGDSILYQLAPSMSRAASLFLFLCELFGFGVPIPVVYVGGDQVEIHHLGAGMAR